MFVEVLLERVVRRDGPAKTATTSTRTTPISPSERRLPAHEPAQAAGRAARPRRAGADELLAALDEVAQAARPWRMRGSSAA